MHVSRVEGALLGVIGGGCSLVILAVVAELSRAAGWPIGIASLGVILLPAVIGFLLGGGGR